MLYVAFLYAALGDPDFEARESASVRLAHLIDRHPAIYGPQLASWCRTSTCPEVRRRALQILVVYQRHQVNSFIPRHVPVWPCCDMLPAAANPCVPFGFAPDIRGRDRTWVSCSPAGSTETAPYWSKYRRGTERMIRQKLIEGSTHEECDALLDRMWAIEQGCRADCTPEVWAISATWRTWSGGYPQP